MGNIFTFREIKEKQELERLFHLRYQVFSENQLAPFLHENSQQVDIDIYDLHSRLFGLYCNNDLVGGIRLVIDKTELYNREVYEIGYKYNVYTEEYNSQSKLITTRYADFPALSYSSVPEEIKLYYESKRLENKFCASSRCILSKSYRGLKTIQFLTESIITIGNLYFGEKPGIGITDVTLSHSSFYCRYGFGLIENEPSYLVNDLPAVTLSISLSSNLPLTSIPVYFHSKLENMSEEYTSTGKIKREI